MVPAPPLENSEGSSFWSRLFTLDSQWIKPKTESLTSRGYDTTTQGNIEMYEEGGSMRSS